MYRLAVGIDDVGLRNPQSHARAKISAMYNLGCLLSAQRRHTEAIAAFQDAVKRLTPDYEPHSLFNMLGQSLHKVGKASDAEFWFKSALEHKPDHIPAYLTYALLLRETGRSDEAKTLYDAAIRINQSDHAVFNHYAKLLIHEGNYAEAAEMIKHACMLPTGISDYETAVLAGDIYRHLEYLEKSETFYRIAVNLKPKIDSAQINLGAILHLQRKYQEAKYWYESALASSPNSEIAMENLRKIERLMKQQNG